MLPIVAAMVLQQQKLSRWRGIELSLWYVFAVALTYALAGIMAVTLGATLQSLLQTPWLLGISGFILLLMAGLLIFPERLMLGGQAIIHRLQNAIPAHTRWGTATLGVLSTLVVSPCVTPPLVGALVYIGNQGDLMLGGSALFMLGLGSGLPLISVALLGTRFLPKAGRWMLAIQYLFALALCLVALSLWGRIGTNLFTPFSQLLTGAPVFTTASATSSVFHRVTTPAALQAHLATAQQQNRPVVLEFYADWCASCQLLKREVFSAANVIEHLNLYHVYAIQVDLTADNPDTQALLSQWRIFGPPMTLFLNAQGQEIPSLRLAGDFSQKTFFIYLQELLRSSAKN